MLHNCKEFGELVVERRAVKRRREPESPWILWILCEFCSWRDFLRSSCWSGKGFHWCLGRFCSFLMSKCFSGEYILCGFAFSAALKIKAKKKCVGRRNTEATLNFISKLGKRFELDVAVTTIWNEDWKTVRFFLPGGFAEFSNCFPGLCEGKSILVPSCISQPCLPVSNTGPTRILPHLYLGCQRDVLNKVGRQRDGERSWCPWAP